MSLLLSALVRNLEVVAAMMEERDRSIRSVSKWRGRCERGVPDHQAVLYDEGIPLRPAVSHAGDWWPRCACESCSEISAQTLSSVSQQQQHARRRRGDAEVEQRARDKIMMSS